MKQRLVTLTEQKRTCRAFGERVIAENSTPEGEGFRMAKMLTLTVLGLNRGKMGGRYHWATPTG
ncbi:hypothetical protein [Nonomuraea sp. NPDC048826]|uniref:hypothetical protein n=1 Tax=Nonomuraea sp. NPDC048826 TaxID=3364347 RepID=UPI0037124816